VARLPNYARFRYSHKDYCNSFRNGFGDNFYDDIIDELLEHNAPIVLDADIFKSERVLEFLEQKERDIV